MKFIREMIVRKRNSADLDEQSELTDHQEEFEPDETSDEELSSVLASIQAKIQGARGGARPGPGNDAQDLPDTDRVEHFADLVSGLAPAAPKSNETPAKMKPATVASSSIRSEIMKPKSTDGPSLPSRQLHERAAQKPSVISIDQRAVARNTAKTALPVPPSSVGATANTAVPPAVAASRPTPAPQPAPEIPRPRETAALPPTPPAATPAPDPEETRAAPPAKSEIDSGKELNKPTPKIVKVPAPAAGRAGRRAGRVKTRLLGFEHAHSQTTDPFDAGKEATGNAQSNFPVGWIVVIDGPGRGTSFALCNGVSQIGRGEDQAIKLDFGDSSISRTNHAAIAYDSEQRTFFLGHGGKANLVRLNDKPVLSTEEVSNRDLIRIGETTLRFVGLCGADFDWGAQSQEELDDAAIA
ncbi:MAG: FHA domain-containing protein [Halocynthiibacter sp.]